MSDPKKLIAFPLIDELQYRSNIDESQLNRMFKSIEESALRAILRGNQIQDLYNQLNLAIETSNKAIAESISRISYSVNSGFGGTIFATGFEGIVLKDDNQVNHDRVAGLITMPYAKNKMFTKISRYDSDGDGIADTVAPTVKIYFDDELRSFENGIYNILNRRNDSFWIEQVAAGTHTIEIELPASLNKKFNYVEIIPLPIFSFKITNIQYYDVRGEAHSLPVSSSINQNWPHILHVSPKEFNNRIKITVDVPTNNPVVGFTNIDIALIDYMDVSQTFYMPFSNVPTASVDMQILLDFDIDRQQVNYKNFITDIRLVSDTDDTLLTVLEPTVAEQIENNVTLSGSLYLKITMKEVDLTTPVIRGCRIICTELA